MLEVKSFSNFILKDISFCSNDKNLIILGDNGAGKTTLAKTLCGLIKSDEVFCDGKRVLDIDYEDRVSLINYIPAKLEIFDEYISVLEYLELNKYFENSHIKEVMELLNISHLKDKACKYLSSGESQLLLIASAILHNAKYTILDEPTSNLDPKKIQNVFEILKDKSLLKNKIIITHNLNLAYKLGFDIVYIQDGKVIFDGSNDEFFKDENLLSLYGNSVKKSENNIVVDI
jgi:iron complex transport system ATP-binding protein